MSKARHKEMLEIGMQIDFSTCCQLAFVFVIGVLGAVHFRDVCRQRVGFLNVRRYVVVCSVVCASQSVQCLCPCMPYAHP